MAVNVEKDGPVTIVTLSRPVCLRGDRLSAIEQFDLPFEKAMVNEFKHGLASIAKEAAEGAGRFAKGAGRHGYFEKPDA